jgi:predicted phage tail component-like protein
MGAKLPAMAPVSRIKKEVGGKPGAYLTRSDIGIRELSIPVLLINREFDNFELLKEDLAEWLYHEEAKTLEFSDEPNRIYYAFINQSVDIDELVNKGRGTLNFVCYDPFKYGPERTYTFPSDYVSVTNEGTHEAKPIFELEVLTPVAFAMIQNQNDEYMMIGRPADDDVSVIDAKQMVYQLTSNDLSNWISRPRDVNSSFIDPTVGGVTDGTFTHDGTGAIVNNFGTPFTERSGYGPSIYRELPSSIQDFELEAIFDTRTDLLEENFRMEVYLFDEGMKNIGKIGIRDRFADFHNRSGLARAGEYEDESTRYVIGRANYDYNNLGKSSMFNFRWKREGQRFTFYVSEIVNGKHVNTLTRTYTDRTNQWTGKIKYVQLFIRSWKGRNPPYLARFNDLKIYELTQATQDETPYIAYPGDVITFDHKDEEMLLNGENVMRLKDFGARFFELQKGTNELVVHPSNAFNVSMTYRETFK